jgi:hypothetical protein
MAEVQTSEVGAKPAPVSLGLQRLTFGNNGNQSITVRQLKPYSFNNGSHSLTHCLATATVVSDVTCIFSNVRKVGDLVISRTSCFF